MKVLAAFTKSERGLILHIWNWKHKHRQQEAEKPAQVGKRLAARRKGAAAHVAEVGPEGTGLFALASPSHSHWKYLWNSVPLSQKKKKKKKEYYSEVCPK